MYKQRGRTIDKLSENVYARSTSFKIRKLQMKTTQRYPFLSMMLAKNKKYAIHPVGKRKHSHALPVNANWYNSFGNLAIYYVTKSHTHLPFESAILLHRLHLENTQPIVHKFIYSIVYNCKILEYLGEKMKMSSLKSHNVLDILRLSEKSKMQLENM